MSYKRAGGKWQVADSRWEPTIGAGSIQTTPSQLVAWAAQYWEPTIGAPTINAERFDGAVDTRPRRCRGMRYGAGIYEIDVGGARRPGAHSRRPLGRVRHRLFGRPGTPRRGRRQLYEPQRVEATRQDARHRSAHRLDRQQLKPHP